MAEYSENFEKAMEYLLGVEGGYSNNKYDRGGATNYGITQSTYDGYNKSNGFKIKNVANITIDEAKTIYYKNYWLASSADRITDLNLALVLFDSAVNHGVGAAKSMYLKSGGDVNKFLELRKQKYLDIVKHNKTQIIFLKGWMNRLKKLQSILK